MAVGKEIRSKIKSVQNTQKITRAMQMVSTSKMKKTQDRMKSARPYANNIRRVMAHLAHVDAYARNTTPLLRRPDEKRKVGIVLITTDKGLCGGLNANALKVFFEQVKQYRDNNIDIEVCAFGQKGYHAATRLGLNIVSSAVNLGDVPRMDKIIGPLSILLEKFHNKELDGVDVIYSHFVNTMKQEALCEQLLPLNEKVLKLDKKMPWDYLYEPSAVEVLNDLIRRYIESVVYQCQADNMASEQAARMIAMKAATDNAGSAINKLQLQYNKSRQASITQELAEIVAGSAAV